MIKYRPQRGSLEESAEEMQVFNSKEEMFASIVNDWSGFISYDDLSITKDFGQDSRINWKETRYVYGSYVGPTVTDPKTGDVYQDDRHRPYPEFMDKITISDFISGCEEMSREQEFDGIENDEFENDEYETDEMSIEA